jgi:hypothetical protein
MAGKGEVVDSMGQLNFRVRKLEWRDEQGAICLYDGSEVLEEKERLLEEMGHAKDPAFYQLVNQRYSYLCVSHLRPHQYYVDRKGKRCVASGANVSKTLEDTPVTCASTATNHPAARATAGGTAREQELSQMHGEQVGLNAALQAEVLQLKAQQKEPAEEAPASAELELAEAKAALDECKRNIELLRKENKSLKAASLVGNDDLDECKRKVELLRKENILYWTTPTG